MNIKNKQKTHRKQNKTKTSGVSVPDLKDGYMSSIYTKKLYSYKKVYTNDSVIYTFQPHV